MVFKKFLKAVAPTDELSPDEMAAIRQNLPHSGPKTLNLEDMLLQFLVQEFQADSKPAALRAASTPMDSPLMVLRHQEGALSVWHRLPVRGESGIPNVVDFAVYRGQHRMSPRDKSPDFLIECRTLDGGISNRTDLHVVQDVIGRSLDVLPGTSILVTNRELSSYARALAERYGINLIEIDHSADPGYRLYKLLGSQDDGTRERLTEILGKSHQKLLNTYRARKRVISPDDLIKKGGLRDRVVKYLVTVPNSSAKEIASALKVHDSFVLNELHTLEKQKKVTVAKAGEGPQGYLHAEWSLVAVPSSGKA